MIEIETQGIEEGESEDLRCTKLDSYGSEVFQTDRRSYTVIGFQELRWRS